MEVKISKERVWWTINTEDKPSKVYFDNFVSNMTTANVRVNFINYDNVSINADTSDITYVSVNHLNYTYYYFVNGVEKILKNSYVLSLTLDTYSSFTLPFLETLKQNKVQVNVLRSHNLDWQKARYFDDPLLEQIPKNYKVKEFLFREQIGVRQSESQYTDGYRTLRYGYSYKCPVFNTYYVFSFAGDNSYTFIPVLSKEKSDSGSPIFVKCDVNDLAQEGWAFGETQVWNRTQDLDELADLYANNFIGIFYLPNIFNFYWKLKQFTHNNFNAKVLTIHAKNNNYIPLSGYDVDIQVPNYPKAPALELMELPLSDLKLNNGEVAYPLIYKYFNPTFYNSIINPNFFNVNNKLTISRYYISFSGSGNLISINDKLNINENILKLSYQLPSTSDNYAKYVQANYNSTSTGLSVAKQQMNLALKHNTQNALLNGIRTLFGGITSSIGNFATGNVAGGISNIAGTGMSLGSTALTTTQRAESLKLAYKNKVQMVQATYKDVRSSSQVTLNYGNEADASLAYYYDNTPPYSSTNASKKQGDGVFIERLDENTIKLMNNTIYLYGNYLPEQDDINKFLNIDFNAFRYVIFNEELLPNIINTYIDLSVPKTEYESVLNDMIGGMRIWDKVPTFSS